MGKDVYRVLAALFTLSCCFIVSDLITLFLLKGEAAAFVFHSQAVLYTGLMILFLKSRYGVRK